MNNRFPCILAAAVLALPLAVFAQDESHDEQDAHETHEGEAAHVRIRPEMAEASGISVRPAGAATIERRLGVFGELVASPDRRAQVRARFPGLIVAVDVDVGDRVERGQTLATVESNESLQGYPLPSPIDGVVQHRHANAGEVAGDESLFVIVDSRLLWAELKVFPARRGEVATEQPVHIESGTRTTESTIEHVLAARNGEPFAIARARVDNADKAWLPGDRVAARILVERVEVPLAVDNRALQQMDGRTVVFVQHGDRFEPRPVELGRRDDRRSEVLSGLSPGASYVVENSYLIKADLEKSGAGHHH
ncbi:MAG: efflux RND transporter periplasmic adaptor subunit [Wenzhouxiangella sp.]|jgi:cobalt-zinc-cadmium efflux system membrane fusion protein|nr:efflux RND transporter periplasmic adaptor subunit [Wenzhouxiangella sp.]